MGFFSKFTENFKELNKLTKSISIFNEFLDLYESNFNKDYLLAAAWVFNAGIMKRINKMKPIDTVYVVEAKRRMTATQVLFMTSARLHKKMFDYYGDEAEEILEKMYNKEDIFYQIESWVDDDLKNSIS